MCCRSLKGLYSILIWLRPLAFIELGFLSLSVGGQTTFRFASIYGDHMVLQQAPLKANLWGYVPLAQCGGIKVTFSGKSIDATVFQGTKN